MRREWIEKMKTSKRLRLNFKDWVTHYNIALFILIIPLFSLKSFFEYYVTKTYDGVIHPIELFKTLSFFFIPVVLIFIFQRNKLRLREFKAKIDKSKFEKTITLTAEENKWHFKDKENDFYRLFTDKDGEGEFGGEMITILRLNNGFLVNSIEDISISSSFFQKKRNRENINFIITNLNETLKN